jgi:4-hydroxy-4-methyl-2-oxoglutarate aldolase
MDALEYILKNRLSTTEVCDALGKPELFDSQLKCLIPGSRAAGYVHYVRTTHGSNYHLHREIVSAPERSIILIDPLKCEDRALFGHLVSKYLFLYRGVSGIVARGLVRDAQAVLKDKFPIWGYGFSPRGCVNTYTHLDDEAEKLRNIYDGALIVADDSGVVLAPKSQLGAGFLEALESIEKKEDKWYYQLDRVKMNTFDIVCKGGK